MFGAPAGSEVVVIERPASMVMEKVCVVCRAGSEESVSCRTKLKPPAAVGVPDSEPSVELSVSPGGREPEAIVQLYGWVP